MGYTMKCTFGEIETTVDGIGKKNTRKMAALSMYEKVKDSVNARKDDIIKGATRKRKIHEGQESGSGRSKKNFIQRTIDPRNAVLRISGNNGNSDEKSGTKRPAQGPSSLESDKDVKPAQNPCSDGPSACPSSSLPENHMLKNSCVPLQFPGTVHYIDNHFECNRICQELMSYSRVISCINDTMFPPNRIERSSSPLVCGFDTEWKPNFVKGQKPHKAAVVQICPSECDCYIFQISAMRGGFPTGLKRLLQDEKILKVGVSMRGDIKRLHQDFQFRSKGTADLSELMNKQCTQPKKNWGLKSLVEHLLHKSLSKSKRITMSNWEKYPLSEKQLRYAALDAYAGLLIYQKLKAE